MLVLLVATSSILGPGRPFKQPRKETVQVGGTSIGITRFKGNVVPTKTRSRAPDSPGRVPGDSLRTWPLPTSSDGVQVVIGSEGRPVNADLDLWQGPDHSPCKLRVYLEDGQMTPLSVVLRTPRDGYPNTVAVRNAGQINYPVNVRVDTESVDTPSISCTSAAVPIQGGARRSYPISAQTESVEVLLRSDVLPLNARIELHQGPDNRKQVIELFSEDGLDRPIFLILRTPGPSNVIRVTNTSPIEFPMNVALVPHTYTDTARSPSSRGFVESARFRQAMRAGGLIDSVSTPLSSSIPQNDPLSAVVVDAVRPQSPPAASAADLGGLASKAPPASAWVSGTPTDASPWYAASERVASERVASAEGEEKKPHSKAKADLQTVIGLQMQAMAWQSVVAVSGTLINMIENKDKK